MCTKIWTLYRIVSELCDSTLTENAVGVHDTAIGFMKLEQAISFEPGNPEKDAKVFFTLAAIDKDKHVENMEQLFDMLTNEELLEALLTVKNG